MSLAVALLVGKDHPEERKERKTKLGPPRRVCPPPPSYENVDKLSDFWSLTFPIMEMGELMSACGSVRKLRRCQKVPGPWRTPGRWPGVRADHKVPACVLSCFYPPLVPGEQAGNVVVPLHR